jgi:hypothetical protein
VTPTVADNKMAAWLLTLPGPFHAVSAAAAAVEARRLFDFRMPQAAFERALRDLGYVIVGHGSTRFSIQPDANDRDDLSPARTTLVA